LHFGEIHFVANEICGLPGEIESGQNFTVSRVEFEKDGLHDSNGL
jgi:hypothetical protein